MMMIRVSNPLKNMPSAWLLLVQLCMLFIMPFRNGSLSAHAVLWILGAVALLLVARLIHTMPVYTVVGMLFVIPALILSGWIFLGHHDPALVITANILESAAYLTAAFGLTRYMFADRYLTRDELFAAANVFTLLVWAFAFLYNACLAWQPHSFSLLDGRTLTWLEVIFLSFSVQSATGLSDIYPLTPMARVLVALQMFAGVMYLALIVSRLIAMQYVRDHPHQPPHDSSF